MTQNRDNISDQIYHILHHLGLIKNSDRLNENKGLFGRGVGLDSVEVLQMVAAIEEEFDLTIDDDDLVPIHFKSVGTFISGSSGISGGFFIGGIEV